MRIPPFRTSAVPTLVRGRTSVRGGSLVAALLLLASQSPFASAVALAQSAPASPSPEHWMADVSGLQRQQLGLVVLPGSHDSATYGFASTPRDGPDPPQYSTIQDIDVATQLQDGIRVLDLRGRKFTFNGTDSYYVYHGNDTTSLQLGTVLDDVGRWVLAPGHDKEVVILRIQAKRSDEASSLNSPAPRFDAMCSTFRQTLGGLRLTPDVFIDAVTRSNQQAAIPQIGNPTAPAPPILAFEHLGNPDLAQYTLGEIWSLPGKQRVIVDWDDCMGSSPAGMWNGYWANQCYAGEYSAAAKLGWSALHAFTPMPDPIMFTRPGIIGAIRDALNGRLQAANGDGQYDGLGSIPTKPTTFTTGPFHTQVPVGFYTLGTHASITPECGYPATWFLKEQAASLDAVKSWFDSNQNNARNYINIVSGDYIEQTSLVAYAIQMNAPAD